MAFYFRCPKCRGYYFISAGPEPVILGPGTRTCGSCKAQFLDRSVEWTGLKKGQKFDVLVPFLYKFFFIAALAVPVISGGDVRTLSFWKQIAGSGVAAAVLWLPYGLFIWQAIRNSLARTPDSVLSS